jgi:arylsulfatase A
MCIFHPDAMCNDVQRFVNRCRTGYCDLQEGCVGDEDQAMPGQAREVMGRTRESFHGVLTAVLAAVAVLACCVFAQDAAAASRPNILLVLVDDIGWGDIRSFNSSGKVSLPTLERLANEGVRFTDAHTATAKCAPTRYSMVTGNYQWRGRHSWGQWNYKGGSQILDGQQTLGDVLRRAGYETALIGKYHLGAHFYKKGTEQFAGRSTADSEVDFARAMRDGPAERGFEYSFIALRGIQDGPYAFFENGRLYGDPADLITWYVGDYGDTQIVREGMGLPNWTTRDVGPTFLSKALAFIDRHQRAQSSVLEPKPFFLYLNTEAAHGPYKPPVSIDDRKVLGTTHSLRGDMLVEIDAVLERLLSDLDQRGLLQDTLVIFTSDNGGSSISSDYNKGHLANGNFRSSKGRIYEGGHRVPLIIKWGPRAFGASLLPAGSVSDALVGTHDLYATLADLVGVPLGADQGRDSVSLLPILSGQATAVRDTIISEADAPEIGGGIEGRHFAYRSGTWKLVFDSSRSPVGLYDLGQDPFETTNLVAESSQNARISAMKASLESALVSDRTTPPLSSEGASVVVPGVVGLTQAAAEAMIAEAGLAVGSVTLQASATVVAGDVISQDPTAGISVTAGSTVNLVVSSGAPASATGSASPTSISFGDRMLNVAAAGQDVTIANTGTTALPISSISLSGSNADQFSRTTNCLSQLAVGYSCTVTVVFKPTSAGNKTANLVIALGDGAGNKTVSLTGTGVNYSFTVSPTSLKFGKVSRGTTSAPKTITVTNTTSTVALPIVSIALAGSNPSQYAQTNNCPAQLSAGASCTVTVTFKPTSSGSKPATLVVTPGNGAAAKSVALSGSGG